MSSRRKTGPDVSAVSRRVRVLSGRLAEARDLHRLATDPLLGAVTADRFRVSITRTMWCFLTLGLGFTTTGVQDFLAGNRTPTDPLWWGAWLAEPALAGILVTLLRWEAAMLSHGRAVDQKPVIYLKRVLLGATLVANVWAGLAPSHGTVSKGMVFFHLVIPIVVFLLAEVMPIIQQHCTAVRDHALTRQDTTTEPKESTVDTVKDVEPHVTDEAPPAAMTSPAAPASVAELSTVAMPRLRLPAAMTERIHAAVTEARQAGREPTPADIQRVVRVPDDLAARIVADLTTVNGHPITT